MLDLQNLAPEQLRPIKRVEYERMVAHGLFVDERIELLDGFLIVMTPIGPPHCDTVDRLNRIFVIALDGRAHVRTQGSFAASDDSEPEPDLAVYPVGNYRREHPSRALLIIEVADSSLAIDRHIKAPLYARAGVPEYWIVDVAGNAVEIYSSPRDGRYQSTVRRGPGDRIAPAAFPDVEILLAELFSGD
jgi:Uma2 family endonuclease